MIMRFARKLEINDLEEFIPQFKDVGTLRLSVLGGQSTSDKEFLQQTKDEITIINNYRKKHEEKVVIEVIETKLPSNSPSQKVMSNVVDLLNSNTYKKLLPAYKILLFYCILLFVTSTVGHTMDKKDGFTNGMLVGVVVSVFLWLNYGKSMSYL